MFALLKALVTKPKPHLRGGVEVPNTDEMSIRDIFKWWLDHEKIEYQDDEEQETLSFTRHGMAFRVFWGVPRDLIVRSLIPELNIRRCQTVEEKAHAYRCLDYVAFQNPGCRPIFDPETGDLSIGFSCFKGTQLYADVLVDLVLYLVENGVHFARKYLNLPAPDVQQPVAMGGGFLASAFSRPYPSTTEALIAWLTKQHDTESVGKEGNVSFVRSGPVTLEVPDPGWPNLCRLRVGTKGFQQAFHDDEKYVFVQEKLDEYRAKPGYLIPYIEETGTLVFSTAALALPGTDLSSIADWMLITISAIILKFSDYMEHFSYDWYDDEANVFGKPAEASS